MEALRAARTSAAACEPEIFGDPAPMRLRGRSAFVTSLQGDLEQASEKMRAVLDEDPDYAWGWLQLVEWADRMGLNEEYLEAAENLLRTSPNHPAAYAYRGDAFLRLERRKEARKDFQRAVQIAPNYFFALRSLLDLDIEDGAFEEAHRLWSACGGHNRA